MENKFNLKDKVRIKDLTTINNEDTLTGITDKMLQYSGKVATILSIGYSTDFDGHYYELDIDNKQWAWDETMLEKV